MNNNITTKKRTGKYCLGLHSSNNPFGSFPPIDPILLEEWIDLETGETEWYITKPLVFTGVDDNGRIIKRVL